MKKRLLVLFLMVVLGSTMSAMAQETVEEDILPTLEEPQHESYRRLRPSEVSDYHLFAELVRRSFAEFRRGDEVYEAYLRSLGIELDLQAGRAFTRAVLRAEALFLDSPPLSAEPVWSPAEQARAGRHVQELRGIYLDLLAGLREGGYPPRRLMDHLERQGRPTVALWVRAGEAEGNPPARKVRVLLGSFSQGAAEELEKPLPLKEAPAAQLAQPVVTGLPLGLGRKVWKLPREETPLFSLVCSFYRSWLDHLQLEERFRWFRYSRIGVREGSDTDKAMTRAALLANAALLDYATVDPLSEGYSEWQDRKIEKQIREVRKIYVQMLRDFRDSGFPLEGWERYLEENVRRSMSITVISGLSGDNSWVRSYEGFAQGIAEELLQAPPREERP